MSPAPETLVVLVPFPMLHPAIDETRLRAIHPRIEVLTTPFEIDHAQRVAREQQPFSEDLRRREPPLSAEQADAFRRAHVVFTLDVPMDLPPLAPNVRWVQAIGSGVGQFVSARLPDAGITLTNGAGIGAPPIAEWVLARTLQIIKLLPVHDANAHDHQWVSALGGQLQGKTVGVIGLGAIGREVARRTGAFGTTNLGVRRSWTPGATDPDVDELFGPAALHEVLGRSDVVVLAAPGTDENEALFDAAAFAAMKPGAIFVNVARGTLVDEVALINALESGHLRAAALDVARTEPLPPEDPLWSAPNIFISPHSSTSGEGYAARAFDLFCRNFERFVAGQPLENVVDLTAGY
ncbi:MAG TPA: D-2-hydroxyacid dehydrogenase [Acidimicrobiales bacterium]|jgi:phosphoglycerate dehydrogenase-like enzyme|nr:D-2-hydroxyacid dehydrogenase [Acidimicrobiales bacterium]